MSCWKRLIDRWNFYLRREIMKDHRPNDAKGYDRHNSSDEGGG